MTALTTQRELRAPRYGLQITRDDEGSDAVIRLDGEFELATAARVRDEIERAHASSRGRVVIDLRGVGFLDSTGMHALVQAHERCQAAGTALVLLLERGPVERTLEVSGLLEMLDHVTSEVA